MPTLPRGPCGPQPPANRRVAPHASHRRCTSAKTACAAWRAWRSFRGLRALGAADNEIADVDALRVLRSAGIALEAAAFLGNPMASLPLYRAHAIAALGPSLATLDGWPVGEEERRGAAAAVAHEATMLSLMAANACLVHKLGRAVQLVRLHCELQCAVLGGRCGGRSDADGPAERQRPRHGRVAAGVGLRRRAVPPGAARHQAGHPPGGGAAPPHAGVGGGRRRRRRRRQQAVAAGVPLALVGCLGPAQQLTPWPCAPSVPRPQAYAQVMLLQQEAIAGLVGMLEQARAQAAAALAPLTRPPSPAKRAALADEREALGRVQQDRRVAGWPAAAAAGAAAGSGARRGCCRHRALSTAPAPLSATAHRREALIRELRDVCMGLANATDCAPQRAAECGARVRQLHAELKVAGSGAQPQVKAAERGGLSPREGPWAIAAVRPDAADSCAAAARHGQQPAAARLKAALAMQQLAEDSSAVPGGSRQGFSGQGGQQAALSSQGRQQAGVAQPAAAPSTRRREEQQPATVSRSQSAGGHR